VLIVEAPDQKMKGFSSVVNVPDIKSEQLHKASIELSEAG
jgi:hypothetical protein